MPKAVLRGQVVDAPRASISPLQLELLYLCSPSNVDVFRARVRELCSAYPDLVIQAQIERLAADGLITADRGIDPRVGWLTVKGKAALEAGLRH